MTFRNFKNNMEYPINIVLSLAIRIVFIIEILTFEVQYQTDWNPVRERNVYAKN